MISSPPVIRCARRDDDHLIGCIIKFNAFLTEVVVRFGTIGFLQQERAPLPALKLAQRDQMALFSHLIALYQRPQIHRATLLAAS
jgi:hypothetical protein